MFSVRRGATMARSAQNEETDISKKIQDLSVDIKDIKNKMRIYIGVSVSIVLLAAPILYNHMDDHKTRIIRIESNEIYKSGALDEKIEARLVKNNNKIQERSDSKINSTVGFLRDRIQSTSNRIDHLFVREHISKEIHAESHSHWIFKSKEEMGRRYNGKEFSYVNINKISDDNTFDSTNLNTVSGI